MIETAQNVADRYGLTREEIDAFALRVQRNAKAARDSGRLAKEIMPVGTSALAPSVRGVGFPAVICVVPIVLENPSAA